MNVISPAMFISHGSPLFALDKGEACNMLAVVGDDFKNCRGLVVVSAHWLTRGLFITANNQLASIHDFGGFPPELYQLDYPAPGSQLLAREIADHLQRIGWEIKLEPSRGRDHGVWVPLLHLLPEAQLPVLQLSLPVNRQPSDLIALGEALALLRCQGIAIVGSGSLTHNLYHLRQGHERVADYVHEFVEWANGVVQRRDTVALQAPEKAHPAYGQAHPSPDHYWPLLVALGASHDTDTLQILDAGVQHYSISMTSYLWRA